MTDYPHPSRVTASGPDYVTGLLPKCPVCPLAEGHAGDHLEGGSTMEDPRIFYSARDGKVYDEEGNEAGTARTTHGRDLERHAQALEQAQKQRAAIDRAGRLAVELESAAGSHHLGTSSTFSGHITKEELYPVVLVHNVPRIGDVRAKFSADRYEASGPDGPVWGFPGGKGWRIYLREILEPAGGKGIGDATRDAINRAAEPVIEAWLASPDYVTARRRAAAWTAQRLIHEAGARAYNLVHARSALLELRDELEPDDFDELATALDHLENAAAILERVPARA